MRCGAVMISIAMFCATGALAQEAPDVELAGLEVRSLSALSDPDLFQVLESLRIDAGIFPEDGVYYAMPDASASLVAVPLVDPARARDLLVLYFSPQTRQHFVLSVATDPLGKQEARLRSATGTELVLTQEGIRLERTTGAGVVDAIDCIARSLGVGLDTSSLGRLLTSATCAATTLNTLVLTAYNCLSVPHPIATIGCINGIAKLISCGLVNCQPPAECFSAIGFGSDTDGTWSSSCPSVHRRGRFAHYYTFTLAERARVQIDLRSSADTYLYLLQGDGSGGRSVASNNNGGEGSDSRISRTLPAGTYTIEATTNPSGTTGSFVISVRR